MDHTVDDVGRFRMSRWPGRFDTAALIDGNVDDDGPRLHEFQVFGSHQYRRASPFNQDRPNQQSE